MTMKSKKSTTTMDSVSRAHQLLKKGFNWCCIGSLACAPSYVYEDNAGRKESKTDALMQIHTMYVPKAALCPITANIIPQRRNWCCFTFSLLIFLNN
ncbi:hypothetical protein Bca4012_078774 [Brassica carinata]